MISKSDSLYFAERLAAEREAASLAKSKAARAAHEALASHYESRLAGLGSRQTSEVQA